MHLAASRIRHDNQQPLRLQLRATALGGCERRLAGQLSGGMMQKLGLACALIHAPRVLLRDESSTGVDPVSRRDFWAILYILRESGVCIVMATADRDEAERCSRLALLHAGAVHHCDTPARLKAAMLEHLRVMLIKEFLQLRRDRTAMMRLLVPLVAQMFMFGYAATFTVHRVSTVVLDVESESGEPQPDLAFRRLGTLRRGGRGTD